MTGPQHEPREDQAASEALDQVVRESRTDLLPPKSLGAAGVERDLFARIAQDRSHVVALAGYRGSSRWGWGIATGLAAAAAMALTVGHAGAPSPMALEASPEVNVTSEASALTARRGAGDVLVGRNGTLGRAGKHATLAAGEVVEMQGAQSVWKAGDKATWLLEDKSRVAVQTSAPLVLRLERGAVEAQVTPVPSGEAFAIDVGDERVAVHGTHLRVARDGDRVRVDLSEGVITIGRPPRTGSTYGSLVMAPAHVQFEIGDVAGSLVVSHEASAVRAPVPLASVAEAETASAAPHAATVEPAPLQPPHPSSAAAVAARNVAPNRHPAESPAAPAAVDPHADETIAAAVRDCEADAPHSSDVTVTVTSSLELTVGDDGFVRAARFSPPLAPEVQSCASTSIYKTRFAEAGVHKVDIVLQR